MAKITTNTTKKNIKVPKSDLQWQKKAVHTLCVLYFKPSKAI